MTAEAPRATLRTCPFWRDVRVFERLASSNDLLKALAQAGAPEGTAVLAWEQTAARGRAGRAWHAPRGGGWLSALLRPPFPAERAGCVSVVTAVSLAQAFRRAWDLPVEVKWPNDLWLYGRKLAGVLVELATRGPRIEWLIVGIGINVNNPLPEARVPPISLSVALGHEVKLETVIATALDALAAGYRRFCREGFAPFLEVWPELSALKGPIAFERGGQHLPAEVVGLDPAGKLIVETARGREALAAEEVHVGLPPT